jgi:hypothetical protein
LDIGKQRPTAEGDHEIVFPGDKVGETCLKFVESNIFLPETRWGIGSPETKEEMADNRARAAVSIEHICKSWTPRTDDLTMERVAEDFRNLSFSSDQFADRTHAIVNPQFTEWLKQAFELRIDRLREPFDNAVKNEFIESDVDSRILSLGVVPILPEELKDQIEEFENTHESIKHVPDHMQSKRLAVYTSNLAKSSGSASSTVSHE